MANTLQILAPHAAWPVVAAATLGGGLLRGLTGFGAALLMAPLLSLVLPARETTCLIILLSAVPLGLAQLRDDDAGVDRVLLKPLTLAALLGLPVGIWLSGALPAAIVGVLLGGVVIACAVAMACGISLPRRASTPLSLGVGAMSGVLTGFAGVGGPPAVLYVMGVERNARRARATFIAFFALLYPLALAVIAAAGAISITALLRGVLLLPLFYLGNRIGERAFRGMPAARFRPLVLAVLIAAGLLAMLRPGAVEASDLVQAHCLSAEAGANSFARIFACVEHKLSKTENYSVLS